MFVMALVLLALILFNGFFSMSEIAVVSARKPRLAQMKKAGCRGADTVLSFQENPETLLSVVQICITLSGIVAGAYGGVEIAEALAPLLAQAPLVGRWAHEIAYAVTVLCITYLTLVVGELVPKALGMRKPEAVAVRVAPVMRCAASVVRPFALFLGWSTRLALRLLRQSGVREEALTEDEIRYVIAQGVTQGTVDRKADELIRNVFRLGDRDVYSVMTPRLDVEWLDAETGREDVHARIAAGKHAHWPVCVGSLEKVTGILDAVDYWRAHAAVPFPALEGLCSPPVYVPASQSALDVLETFRDHRVHLALVLDEYGTTAGIVTLHDLVEDIFGALPGAEASGGEAPVFERADGSLLVDGAFAFDELSERLGLPEPGPAARAFSTVAGFVLMEMKRVPHAGDAFEKSGYRFEVVDMDGPRVDKILVSRTAPPAMPDET